MQGADVHESFDCRHSAELAWPWLTGVPVRGSTARPPRRGTPTLLLLSGRELASFDANDDRAQDADRTILLLAMNKTPASPIAVIAMTCRLPGGIESPDQLGDALLPGDDPVTQIPPHRWHADEYYDPEPGVPGRSVSRWGAFCDDVAGLDPEFFGINEPETTTIDPQHRLPPETSREATEHAGLTPKTVADSLTGAFVGLTHCDYQLVTADSQAMEGPCGYAGHAPTTKGDLRFTVS